jgi:hypothetical protein
MEIPRGLGRAPRDSIMHGGTEKNQGCMTILPAPLDIFSEGDAAL